MQTSAIAPSPHLDADGLLKVLTGNTKNLSAEQKVSLVQGICEATGLDYRLSPFEFITFQGKEVLYARKNAADQLVRIHGLKLSITNQETVDGIRVVTCAADAKDGRHTEDVGATSVKGLGGDALANAMMKAVTKAKRRTVLSICGLSMLDESELETIPGAHQTTTAATVPPPPPTVPVVDAFGPAVDAPDPIRVPTPGVYAALWAKTQEKYRKLAAPKMAWAVKAVGIPPETSTDDWTPEQAYEVEKLLFPMP
jgi:hypothetical protein